MDSKPGKSWGKELPTGPIVNALASQNRQTGPIGPRSSKPLKFYKNEMPAKFKKKHFFHFCLKKNFFVEKKIFFCFKIKNKNAQNYVVLNGFIHV